MHPLFESLEARSLFSVALATPAHMAELASPMVYTAMAVLPRVVGTWKGTLTLPGVHTKTVKIVIKTQTHTGKITGTLTTSLDPSIHVSLTGKVTATGRLYLTLLGSHGGGLISGTGSGKLKVSNTRVSLAMAFSQGGQIFPGTISIHRV